MIVPSISRVLIVTLSATGSMFIFRCSGEVPAARYGHTAVLVGSRMFVWGGKSESTLLGDMYFLDLEKWAWVPVSSTTSGPPPRMNHASLLVGRKIVMHGGWDGAERCFNDLWVFDTEAFTWTCPVTAGLPPSPRYGWFAGPALSHLPPSLPPPLPKKKSQVLTSSNNAVCLQVTRCSFLTTGVSSFLAGSR